MMSLICLASASGSPGVTTTAVAAALAWPRPVMLVEADPTGSSAVLAGYLRGQLEHRTSVLDVALSPLDHADSLRDRLVPLGDSGVRFLPGLRSPAQASGLRDFWSQFAETLSGLDQFGQDVIVDAGRLGLEGTPWPLLAAADATLLLTRTGLPNIAAARSRLDLIERDRLWKNAGVVLVGDGQPYRAQDVAKALGIPVIAALADDPSSASVFARGRTPDKDLDNRPLAQSLRALVASIQAHLARSRWHQAEAVGP